MGRLSAGDITVLLHAWSDGETSARDQLARLVYQDLRRVARARLRRAGKSSLSPSDVVQEAYVRLLRQEPRWANRVHFFAVAAEMMRRVLVDHARARGAQKRGGAETRVTVTEVEGGKPRALDLIALDRALDELADLDHQQVRVVELHYFGGLTFEEIAEVLTISPAAAKRSWASARLWLRWRLRSLASSASAHE